MTQLTDIEMAFRDALWEEIGSHADMTIGELNLAVHRTLTALEAKGLGVLPLRPTEEMLERARDDNLVPFASRWHAREIYRTMVSAARGDG